MTWTTRCPAKLNLALTVYEPDDSGYHPIKSIFQAVNLFDTLTVRKSNEDAVIGDVPPENTLTKTVRLFRELYLLPKIEIQIEKNIPSEAGLGGGSSDAAGLLRIIQRITGCTDTEFLSDVARGVGADVSFFLRGGRAMVEGYGEKINQEKIIEKENYLIIKPLIGMNTAHAYKQLDKIPRKIGHFEIGHNDFERLAPCECHDLIERMMVFGAEYAMLSGSGSAVFGKYADEVAARKAQSELGGWVVQSLDVRESTEVLCLT